MIKIFLSHSWAQKKLVDDVAELVGRDFAIVDRFVFESGAKIEDEINKSLDTSNVFVMLISNEALESEWCKYELSRFRENFLDEKLIEFVPFIVDDTDVEDKRIKPWIRAYLTNPYKTAIPLARVIRRRVCEVLWKANPDIDASSRIFLGRDMDLTSITNRLNEKLNVDRRAIIVSGLPHIGRKRLLREVYVTRMGQSIHPSYDLYDISLGETDSIEDFIVQLNEFVEKYDKDYLQKLMADGSLCKTIAVELINEVSTLHERIRINDDKAIVTSSGKLSDWFVDIIQDDGLVKQTMLFVASSCSLSPSSERGVKQVQSHKISALEKTSLRQIFVAYAKARSVRCPEKQIDEFIQSLGGYPKQVYCIVDDIANYDLQTAKDDLKNISSMFDSDIKSVVDIFQDENSSQLLILLSKFEFISYDFLQRLYSFNDLDSLLTKFRFYSIYDTFGSCNQYIRLNYAISDYIGRQRKKLNSTLSTRLTQETKNLLSSHTCSSDLSEDLFKIKEQIKDPKFVLSSEYLLPSYALKVIIDLYRKGEYDNVIMIANKILYDYKRNNYETIEYPIRWWLCQAYCHKGDERVFSECKTLSDYGRFFILGYFNRIKGDYPTAQYYFEKALATRKDKNARFYYKAEHEMVIVLMKLKNYPDALNLAHSCYVKDKHSPYFIQAYYRCYVRSRFPDKAVLDELIAGMAVSDYRDKEIVVETMKAERMFFVDKNIPLAMKTLKNILSSNRSPALNYTAETLKEVCDKQEMKNQYKSIISECGHFEEDENFVIE